MNTLRKLVEKNLKEKEVKKMKKLLTVLTVMALVVSYAAPASAAFTTIGTPLRKTATVTTVTGTGGVIFPFALSLRNLSDNNEATEIGWNSVTAGTTNWLNANQYVQAEGFANWDIWGIQAYTDNKRSDASPKYTGPTGSNPAGLVCTTDTTKTLPICWRTKVGYYKPDGSYSAPGSTAISAQEKQIYQGAITVGDITMAVLYDGVTGHEPGGSKPYYPWFFMLDKLTPDVDPLTTGNQPFGNYQAEATFIGSKGYHHAPGTVNYGMPANAQDRYYVYLGAKFLTAAPAKTYTTNSLYVEAYHL